MESDREKIEKLTKEYEEVYLVAGTINATGKTLYWKDENYIAIGNYAIVENMNGYDLIKVIGRIATTKRNASKFSNTKYENMKKTIKEINRILIKDD